MADMGKRHSAERIATGAQYIPAFDMLRAVAVAMVLYTHYLPEPYWLGGLYWGAVGVRFFFVLSGFLITGLLLDDTRLQAAPVAAWRHFLLARMARLYPCLLVFLLAFAFLDGEEARWMVPSDALYLSNLRMLLLEDWGGRNAHLWSLAVEQQFYLVWPWMIALVPRRVLPIAICLTIAAALAFRLGWSLAGLSPFGAYVLPLAYLDFLGIGALVAVALRSAVPRLVVAAGLLACWAAIWQFPPPLALYSAEPWKLASACLYGAVIALCARRFGPGPVGRLLEARPLVWVGRISYGIYMYHQIAPGILEHLSGKALTGPFTGLLCAAITLLLAAASHALVEQPIRRLIARRMPRPAAARTETAATLAPGTAAPSPDAGAALP
ncbi:acyltransferase [Frigidibacter sp. MR17.14]|uniref:acyltransferase family protein n=1 Tax=Frigidibacter sp. MR17.14 TaxID=3126509 RepID=UPI003012C0CF